MIMKTHTTNYFDTFIEIAEDSPADTAEAPPVKGEKKTVANIEYDLLHKHPYRYTSDDVLFQVYAIRHDLTQAELEQAREQFFSKGQPCFRASPLTKRYGWGIHHNHDGKIALVAAGSAAYKKYSADKKLTVVKAMRSRR